MLLRRNLGGIPDLGVLLRRNTVDFWIEGRFFRRNTPDFGVEACLSGRDAPFFGFEGPFPPKRIPARKISSGSSDGDSSTKSSNYIICGTAA